VFYALVSIPRLILIDSPIRLILPHIGIPSRRFTLIISEIKRICMLDASSEKLGHRNLLSR